MRPVYVNSITQISCGEPLGDAWTDCRTPLSEGINETREADYPAIIPARLLRRMPSLLRRSAATSLTALKKAGITSPDAIFTGTGMGCMANSEQLLHEMALFDEQSLKPTLFMQSTHNTIGTAIAMILGCHGYNTTYSHRGISFDSALLDAFIAIGSGNIGTALVGCHDELPPVVARNIGLTNPDFKHPAELSVASVLSSVRTGTTLCAIEDIRIFHRPDMNRLAARIPGDIECLVTGTNGSPLNDRSYGKIIRKFGDKAEIHTYKDIFGDSYASSAAGFLVAARLASDKQVCLVSHSDGIDWSLVLLTPVDALGIRKSGGQ